MSEEGSETLHSERVWNFTAFEYGAVGFGIGIVILVSSRIIPISRFYSICTSVSFTVGMIALASMTTFVEQYLKVLAYFQLRVPKSDCPDGKPCHSRISYMEHLRHLAHLGQRILTFKAAADILISSDWHPVLLTIILSSILIPRTMFAFFVIRNQQDPFSVPQPKDPKRGVNMSIKLLHYVYKGCRHFFGALSGVETCIFFLSKQCQFVTLQLLGYNYNDIRISIFGDIETVIFTVWNIWIGSSSLNSNATFLLSLFVILLVRICFRVSDQHNMKSS